MALVVSKKFEYFGLERKVIDFELAFFIDARLLTTASPLPITLEFVYSARSASVKFFSSDTTLIEYWPLMQQHQA